MANNRSDHKSEAGLRNGTISLTSGIVSILFVIYGGLIGGRLIVAAAPLALIGLFFGGIGLNSTDKWRFLALTGVMVCFLALLLSIFAHLGAWFMGNPIY